MVYTSPFFVNIISSKTRIPRDCNGYAGNYTASVTLLSIIRQDEDPVRTAERLLHVEIHDCRTIIPNKRNARICQK